MSLNLVLNSDTNEEIYSNIISTEQIKTKKNAVAKKKDNSQNLKKVKSRDDSKINNNETKVEIASEEEDILMLDNLAEKYKKKTQLEHIKDLPDTYIGSIIKETTNVWSFENNSMSINTYRIINKEIEYAPGLRSIIEEILVNAFDNMNRINQKIAIEKKRLKKVSILKYGQIK